MLKRSRNSKTVDIFADIVIRSDGLELTCEEIPDVEVDCASSFTAQKDDIKSRYSINNK